MYKMPGNGINGKGKTKKAQDKKKEEEEESTWQTVDNKGKKNTIESKYVLWFHTETNRIFATQTWNNLQVRDKVVKSWKQSVMGNILVYKKSIATREQAYLKSLAQAREPEAIYDSIAGAKKDADALIQVLTEAKTWMKTIIETLINTYGLKPGVLSAKKINNPPRVDGDEIKKLLKDHDAKPNPIPPSDGGESTPSEHQSAKSSELSNDSTTRGDWNRVDMTVEQLQGQVGVESKSIESLWQMVSDLSRKVSDLSDDINQFENRLDMVINEAFANGMPTHPPNNTIRDRDEIWQADSLRGLSWSELESLMTDNGIDLHSEKQFGIIIKLINRWVYSQDISNEIIPKNILEEFTFNSYLVAAGAAAWGQKHNGDRSTWEPIPYQYMWDCKLNDQFEFVTDEAQINTDLNPKGYVATKDDKGILVRPWRKRAAWTRACEVEWLLMDDLMQKPDDSPETLAKKTALRKTKRTFVRPDGNDKHRLLSFGSTVLKDFTHWIV
tara:strand:+ start:104 stop:1597 length:1494 start_codon:yes stop_codon:yes gene_type:complete